MNELILAEAIKEKCLECCWGNKDEIRLCCLDECPLYPYRLEHLSSDEGNTSEEETADVQGITYDTYKIVVTKLELTKSKKGDPMVTCWMKIVEGAYKGSLIFMNQVVTQDFQFHIVNEFVRDLVSECEDAPDIHFHTFNQYGNMLMDVMELIENKFEYKLVYDKNNKGYNTFEIEEVYPLED